MFSSLMSVYHGSCPDQLKICLDSFLTSTLIPEQIVIVLDGPVSEGVLETINNYPQLPIDVCSTPKNNGLGPALNYGLARCRNELIARMDTDDALKPDRFEKQVKFFELWPYVSCLGGFIEEADDLTEEDQVRTLRKVPLGELEFKFFSYFRNPMNHVTVMFRKSAVINVGGYPDILYREDYALWHLLSRNGYQLKNAPEVTVSVTADEAMLARRHGFLNFKIEFRFFVFRLRTAPLSGPIYLFAFVIRAFSFFLPKSIFKGLYNFVLRSDRASS